MSVAPRAPHKTGDDPYAAHKAELDEQGYTVVENALTPEAVEALRARLIEQAEGETARGVATFDGGAEGPNQRLWMLVNKGAIFRDLLLHPVVDTFMSYLLGKDYLCSSLTGNIAAPGGEQMIIHRDQPFAGWTPAPLVANIAFMLDDFTRENGATVLIPGSHRDKAEAPDPSKLVSATGPKGGALIFEGRIWHGTGENTTANEKRHALLAYHCRPYIRQQENFFLGLREDLIESERPAFLGRLGFKQWMGYGRIERPRQAGLMTRQTPRAGPLDAEGRPIDV